MGKALGPVTRPGLPVGTEAHAQLSCTLTCDVPQTLGGSDLSPRAFVDDAKQATHTHDTCEPGVTFTGTTLGKSDDRTAAHTISFPHTTLGA